MGYYERYEMKSEKYRNNVKRTGLKIKVKLSLSIINCAGHHTTYRGVEV
jgi:hypothetical protein